MIAHRPLIRASLIPVLLSIACAHAPLPSDQAASSHLLKLIAADGFMPLDSQSASVRWAHAHGQLGPGGIRIPQDPLLESQIIRIALNANCSATLLPSQIVHDVVVYSSISLECKRLWPASVRQSTSTWRSALELPMRSSGALCFDTKKGPNAVDFRQLQRTDGALDSVIIISQSLCFDWQ